MLGKPNWFLREKSHILLWERETLHVSAGKGRDCGELLRIQKGNIQAFFTAFIMETSEISVSQTSPILYKNTLLWSIAGLQLHLASHRFVLPLLCRCSSVLNCAGCFFLPGTVSNTFRIPEEKRHGNFLAEKNCFLALHGGVMLW